MLYRVQGILYAKHLPAFYKGWEISYFAHIKPRSNINIQIFFKFTPCIVGILGEGRHWWDPKTEDSDRLWRQWISSAGRHSILLQKRERAVLKTRFKTQFWFWPRVKTEIAWFLPQAKLFRSSRSLCKIGQLFSSKWSRGTTTRQGVHIHQ